ncbi:MAG: transglycosylase SLT domain-containing protein [Saprospiraceae bacterium]
MEPSALRTLTTTLLCVLFFAHIRATTPSPTFNVEEIKPRLETMECIVKPRYTPEVERYIKNYLGRSKRSAATVMGRAAIFFPIFEKYLEEHNLPKDLKYLAIVESALNPKAMSPVGAGGLWQFMKGTGQLYGLTINREVDERSCPHSSTEAAMKYLAKQYERFGSWEMALAAYNCGAGTILRAQKRARTNDYWKLARYLPRETRNFVPAFIGVAYIVNYYDLYDVEPAYPSLDMQLIEATRVYPKITFKTIAAVTGIPIDIVRQLNPHFKRSYVPESPGGHYVILPKRVMPSFKDYLGMLRPDDGSEDKIPALPEIIDTATYFACDYYFKSSYKVIKGDKFDDLAKLFGCSEYSLKIWSHLTGGQLTEGQELTVWFPKEIRHFGKEVNHVKVEAPVRKPVRVGNITRLPSCPLTSLSTVSASPAKLSVPTALTTWGAGVVATHRELAKVRQKSVEKKKGSPFRKLWRRIGFSK